MNEEKLREALKNISLYLDSYIRDCGLDIDRLKLATTVQEKLQQALSEAGDEPEMVKLGKRLKELRAKQRLEAEAAHDRQAWVVSHDASTRAGIYSLVIEIIEREFGHSLPEGEE